MTSNNTKTTGRKSDDESPFRRRIIDAARTVFAERGYRLSGVRHISVVASLRKSVIYHHFPTRESIYFAVLDEVLGEVRSLFIAMHIAEGSYSERLETTAAKTLDYLEENIEGARILAREIIDVGPFMKNHGQRSLELVLQLGVSFLRQGMKAGEFKLQGASQLMLSLFSLCLYTYASAQVTHTLLNVDLTLSRRERLMSPIRTLCIEPETFFFTPPVEYDETLIRL
jgi:AcrR family transcriptional regulator